ncbi:hypothetical protein MHYP_G00337660 [Metynnis hypsauchen]
MGPSNTSAKPGHHLLGWIRCGGHQAVDQRSRIDEQVHAHAHSLTCIVLVEGVHAGEVDGERLEGGGQADAALRALHVEARGRGRRLRRLGQARLAILHAEHGTRRLGRLLPAPSPADREKRKKG